MHKITPEQRGRLGINELSPDVKQYISDLELAVDRLQVRSHAHREQLRSCNAKLEMANLKTELANLAGQGAVTLRSPDVLVDQVAARVADKAQRDTKSQIRRKTLQRAV